MADQHSFQILRITSYSDHPIRNSAGELIFGEHTLWYGDNGYVSDKGSLTPNVFAYDFTSPLVSNSTLYVTVKVVNYQLFGSDYVLYGCLDGWNRVFESRVFTIGSTEEIIIAVCVVQPHNSPEPLAFNGHFTWVMIPKEQKQSGQKPEYTCPDKPYLELYWISIKIHEIFFGGLSGIHIDFLRYSILKYDFNNCKTDVCKTNPHPNPLSTTVHAAAQRATIQAFLGYSKRYDTDEGASHFGVTPSGGPFDYHHYITARRQNGELGPPGSLSPIVNCYDQAAMVEVLCSIGHSTRLSWLYQSPKGFIHPTYLVGIPGLCNNPFYESTSPPGRMLIHRDDPIRTKFANHVFNGLKDWTVGSPNSDNRIYDACGGPQVGIQNPEGYLRATTNKITSLYESTRTRPGTVNDIRQFPGVTLHTTHHSVISNSMQKFLQKCSFGITKQHSQIHWDDVPKWVKTILGDSCDIAFQNIDIGDGVVVLLWHLTDVEGVDGDVVVRVRVETYIDEDGNLDVERSSRAALDHLAFRLTNCERYLGPNLEVLDTIWTPAPFENYAQYALQHSAHMSQGCIMLVSGNCMIDVSGGSSSFKLEPMLRKLLKHTTVGAPFTLHIPKVTQWSYEIPEANRSHYNSIKGICSSFDVKCQVDDIIAAASADVKDHGLLLSRTKIEHNEASKTSTVAFTFVTREVGTHDVELRFAGALSMITSAQTSIQVLVVDE